MASKVNPAELAINDHLESARPLTKATFEALKSGRIEESELNDKQLEFYHSVVGLAKSLEQNGQRYPCTCRTGSDGEYELITGYRRYLACLYSGKAVKIETQRASEEDVLSMIYDENENREDLNPQARAVVIAKMMGRWDEDEGFLKPDHSEADKDAMTIAEFAEQVGKNRGVVYHQLSPVRQSRKMREDFADSLTESSLRLIERITDDYAEQYTLAQALDKSDVDTHSTFEGTCKLAKQKDGNTVENICRSLIGLEVKDVKGDFEMKQKKKTRKQKKAKELDEKARRRGKKQEEMNKRKDENVGQKMPEPTESSDEEQDLNIPEEEDGMKMNNHDGGLGGSGSSVLPREEDQPWDDGKIDVTIPEGEVCQLIREECDDRDIEPGEFVSEIMEVHFRREGVLTDTPGAIQAD